jgi:hypothetical protein
MGDYYNATRGPLSASLTDGSALSLGPKKWIYISPANESSASIIKLLDKGFLVRSKVARTFPEAVPEAASEAAPAVIAPPPSAPSVSTSSKLEEFSRKKK